ncbi:hypothetical protein CR513_60155, partial [Mucuna pruriens]
MSRAILLEDTFNTKLIVLPPKRTPLGVPLELRPHHQVMPNTKRQDRGVGTGWTPTKIRQKKRGMRRRLESNPKRREANLRRKEP